MLLICSPDTDKSPVFSPFLFKYNRSVGRCIQCVVPAAAYINTGMKPGAPLPDQDIPRLDCFTAVAFDAQALGFGITAVTCAAACFFMCHCRAPDDYWVLIPVIFNSV